jgi:hypothetical protein
MWKLRLSYISLVPYLKYYLQCAEGACTFFWFSNTLGFKLAVSHFVRVRFCRRFIFFDINKQKLRWGPHHTWTFRAHILNLVHTSRTASLRLFLGWIRYFGDEFYERYYSQLLWWLKCFDKQTGSNAPRISGWNFGEKSKISQIQPEFFEISAPDLRSGQYCSFVNYVLPKVKDYLHTQATPTRIQIHRVQ